MKKKTDEELEEIAEWEEDAEAMATVSCRISNKSLGELNFYIRPRCNFEDFHIFHSS